MLLPEQAANIFVNFITLNDNTMCYNYDVFIRDEESGELFNKYKLRPIERMQIEERNKEWEKLKEYFNFYYTNGFTHSALPVITQEQPDEIQYFHWGLIPFWVKSKKEADTLKKQTLNAKCETIFKLPSFRGSIRTKRCLIPATGFYEWREVDGKKYPYRIQVKSESFPDSTRQFSFGGLYSEWVDKETGEVVNTFTIITTPANPLMEVIHNTKKRMPLILSEKDEQEWLRPGLTDDEIKALMKPYDETRMLAYTISKLITTNNVDRNVSQIYKPFEFPNVEPLLLGGGSIMEGLDKIEQQEEENEEDGWLF